MKTEDIPSVTIDFTKVPLSDFEDMSRDEQIETMRSWFFENYEDPVERTPYPIFELFMLKTQKKGLFLTF